MFDWLLDPAWPLVAPELVALELDGAADWLEDDCEVAPPEAEPDFFSGSVVVADELDEPDDGGVLGVAEDEELAEPDGGVALPPTDAEPETEPPAGALGLVVEDDEEAVSRGADGEVVVEEDEVR